MTQPGVRVLICGDREWDDRQVIEVVVRGLRDKFGTLLSIIEGEARGADTLARDAAERIGVDVAKFPAKWDEHGKAAGPIRNEQMLREGKPDVVFAFHDFLAESRGTRDMVARARKADVPVYVIARAM